MNVSRGKHNLICLTTKYGHPDRKFMFFAVHLHIPDIASVCSLAIVNNLIQYSFPVNPLFRKPSVQLCYFKIANS